MKDMDTNILERRLKALVRLDELMTPPEMEYLRFATSGMDHDCRWYILDNGSGDHLTVLFTETGVLVKGFDHENGSNQFAAEEWNDSFFETMFKGMPESLFHLMTKDERNETTFCMWYLNSDSKWYQNEEPDNDGGKSNLLGYIPQSAESFGEWVAKYYEQDFDSAVIAKLFENRELTEEEIAAIAK